MLAEEVCMNNSETCLLHGSDLRPALCSDCSRIDARRPAPADLRLTSTMVGQIERVFDARGRVSFRPTRAVVQPLRMSAPWAQRWD